MICKYCKEEITNKKRPKYCSNKCLYKDHGKRFTKRKCQVCDKEFLISLSRTKDKSRGKFCSPQCKAKNQSQQQMGKENPNWHGGYTVRGDGYILIYQPNHPYCDKDGYVREHRLVMEKKIGRYLKPKEVVHHLNEVKDCNLEDNLKLFADEREHHNGAI